jgi:hypothetical protein
MLAVVRFRVEMRVVLALVAMCAVARAQQMPCEPCVRGEDTLSQLGEHAPALKRGTMQLLHRQIGPTQMTLQNQQQIRAVLGADADPIASSLTPLSDTQLEDVAAAICGQPSGDCTTDVFGQLRCIAGRCQVIQDVIQDHVVEPACDPTVKTVRSPKRGLGIDWATGWHDDAKPVDHRTWSIGFEGRARLGRTFGVVGRLDRSTGRDAAEDVNRDGRDDLSTGAVTRVSVLAGPSMMFGIARGEDPPRFAQIDLLGGYQWTLSQSGEDGLLAGVDLSYYLAVARAGVRVTQGFGDADKARAVVGHVGFVVGAGPNYSYGSGCGLETPKSSTRFALAVDLPLFGYGLSSQLDYVAPGFGFEADYHVASFLDVLGHADLLWIPNSGRDRTIYQTVLAGGRLDLTGKTEKSTRTGFFTTFGAGYAFAAATEPSTAGSGPVGDVSVGWGGQGDDGMMYVRLHGRFGLTPDNADARLVFVSWGIELRLDRRKWRDRI